MFDAIDLSQFPAGPVAVAGYIDGRWQTAAALAARFPNARHLSIAVSAADDAGCLDVENGDATPADVPGWYERQRAKGAERPCLYANASTMEAGIVPLVKSGTIPRASVRLWSAHYAGEHICSNATCGTVSIQMDGTQWTNRAFNRDLDQSALLPDFFGAPAPKPPPTAPPWQEAIMNQLPVLREGDADKPGEVYFVSRMQALVKVVGLLAGNDLTNAACQEMTGTFDAATAAAVRQVQEDRKITADGEVGPVTWSVLITGSAS
jgi:peptidoglycan hydrolase-like protein with peptidoglycan-binding domain